MEVELPAQVQRQIDEVAEYDRQVEAAQAAEAAPAGDPPEPASAEPVAAAPAAAPVEAPKVEEETWKARYLTLQGMFNQQVPGLQAEVRQVRALLDAANSEIATLKAPKPAAPAPAAAVDPKDVETYGADLMAVIEKVADGKIAAATATLEAERTKLTGEVAELKKASGTTAEQQTLERRKAYYGELEKLVPTYEAVNAEPAFLEWLKVIDPMFGLSRDQGLKNAFDNFDVRRTAMVFTSFLEANGGKPPVPQPKPAADPALERLVQPAGSKAVTPPADPSTDNTRTWSGNEIDLFYRQVSQGAFKGQEAEQARIEAAIDLAAAEHRIS